MRVVQKLAENLRSASLLKIRKEYVMKTPKLALASMAVASSAVAILSLSSTAFADPPPSSCAPGWSCLLGYTVDLLYGPIGHAPVPYPEGWGTWNYGSCGYDTSSPPVCSCQGWQNTNIWFSVAYPGGPPTEPFLWGIDSQWVVHKHDPQCEFPE